MINADDLHEAEQQALGQLAKMDLALAAHLHALAMASDEPKEVDSLSRAYQRASRCVRQTLMLRARLRHERERHVAATTPLGRAASGLFDDDAEASESEVARVDRRILDLQRAAARIAAQTSPDRLRAERLDAIDRIDAWIDQEVDNQHEDFGRQDLDAHVLELCRACDLPEDLGRRFRELPRSEEEQDDQAEFSGAEDFEPPRRDTG